MAKRENSKEMRNRLLESGLRLFQEQGYNATGIQQIATNAGAPKGSFYNHFSSKEAFGTVIIDEYSAQLQSFWNHVLSKGPTEPDLAIRNLFEKMIAHHEKNECFLGCLISNLSAEISASSELCRQHLRSAHQIWRIELTKLVKQAQQTGKARTDMDAEALASLMWNVWSGGLLRAKNDKSVKPLHDAVDEFLNLILPPSTI